MAPTALCRECNSPLHPGAKFCAACGRPVDAEASRRQLTVLFCDVVGSVALSERLDPEDLRDLLNSYRRVCQDAILRYEGHIAQYLGDGVMAYFGYPIAHEDDAVRASAAALSIVEGIKLVNQGIGRRLRAEIHVRVGLNTGVAVIGDVGPQSAQDRLAHGEAVNMASRVQATAEIDAVVVSPSTAKLIDGHFDLSPMGTHALKGFSRAVDLYRVVQATGARSRFEAAARGHLTPHVGREAEFAKLKSTWGAVLDGEDRAMIVRGEAGVGKSRFVHRFRNDVIDGETRILECLCSPLAQATALAPITEMLEARALERARLDGAPENPLAGLASMLGEYSRFGADTLPLMAALLGFPGADETPIQDLTSARRRSRTLEILREWMGKSAERTPMVLLVEDVHWADPTTLDFLNFVVAEPPGGRTLVLMTARPEFAIPWFEEQVARIDLRRLAPTQAEAMVKSIAGARSLTPLFVHRIVERSEGVPLYVEEVTKAALESADLRLDAAGHEGMRESGDDFMPSSVHGSLIARYDRLGDSRGVAQLGAAIGREFDYALISAVAEMDEETLGRHLARISQNELAFVHGEPPTAVYMFKHALIQEAVYETLLRSERVRVHERIFRTLGDRFPAIASARPDLLAYHAESAGRRDVAVCLLAEAGTRALSRVACAEAVKHLAHALEMVEALPEAQRYAMETELQAALGPAYMATMGWASPEVEASSKRLLELATARGDTVRIFQAMWGLWTVDFLRANLEPALAIAQQVLDTARAAGSPMLLVLGHHAVGYTRFFRADYEEALEHADAGLELFDLAQEKQIASIFVFSSSVAMWSFRAEAQYMLGREQASNESIGEWQKLLTELGHPPSHAYSLIQQCSLYYARQDVNEVHRLASEVRTLALSEGFRLWIPIAEIFLAWVAARRGQDATAALADLRGAMKKAAETLTFIRELDFTGMLAEVLLLAKRPGEVAAAVDAAVALGDRGALRHNEAELLRLKGEAARAMGDREAAASAYREGMERARGVGAKMLEARLAASIQRLDDDDPRPATA
ncbi:MAG TPA: adenylate/guanylate cyclase domain-containing protein [Polyangiaceae bacterium]|nr:adenylate/guanylate cyclase domain-containing protein [Polyangiaceae bacterium]